MNDFWYFGCDREAGHYLFSRFQPGQRMHGDDPRMDFPAHLLDGTFAPVGKEPATWKRVVLVRRTPLTIIAGWDSTVDKRPGSNAAFISHGVLTREQMLARATESFYAHHHRIFVTGPSVTWVE